MFEIKVVEEIKTHVLRSVTPPPPPRKSCRLRDNVEKSGGAREDANNMAPARGILDK
jgi:hypothetical protein